MKALLFDYSNEGILYVGNSLPVVNHLKRGLVDAEPRILGWTHAGYTKINKETFTDDVHLKVTRESDIVELSEASRNEIYLERRRLVGLRAQLIEQVCYAAWLISTKARIAPWDGFENNLKSALDNSDPKQEVWDSSLLEYSHINFIEPKYAYKEIKLQYENIQSLKMRSYATMIYFIDKINTITKAEEKAPMRKEISDRFWRDAWI